MEQVLFRVRHLASPHESAASSLVSPWHLPRGGLILTGEQEEPIIGSNLVLPSLRQNSLGEVLSPVFPHGGFFLTTDHTVISRTYSNTI